MSAISRLPLVLPAVVEPTFPKIVFLGKVGSTAMGPSSAHSIAEVVEPTSILPKAGQVAERVLTLDTDPTLERARRALASSPVLNLRLMPLNR